MEPSTEKRIVLILRKTRLAELIARFNTESQARFYVEHLGADFSDYQREDATYQAAAAKATAAPRCTGPPACAAARISAKLSLRPRRHHRGARAGRPRWPTR